jgi:hypothetical protein
MESDYGTWKNAACKACAAAVAGVCAAHALQTPTEHHQPVQFYQSDEHPEQQPILQPQQGNRAVAATSAIALDDDNGWWATFGMRQSTAATSAIRSFLSGMASDDWQ